VHLLTSGGTNMSIAASTVLSHGGRPLLYALSKNWWLMLLRGVCAIAFGAIALVLPGITLVTLVVIYGAFALVDGVFALFIAARGEKETPRIWLAVTGLLGVAAGVVTFFWPAMTLSILLLIIAWWSIAMGIGQIVGAVRLRKEIRNEWSLAIAGVALIVFGVILLFQPATGALALALLIGIDAIVFGGLMVFLALKLRIHGPKPTTHPEGGVHA
jgi:uncharacterized membrane protein HdeD (DUF308 family)